MKFMPNMLYSKGKQCVNFEQDRSVTLQNITGLVNGASQFSDPPLQKTKREWSEFHATL